MSKSTLSALEKFRADWNELLNMSVRFEVYVGPRPAGGKTADTFVQQHGFKPIGFNWELLDSEAGIGATRSAFGTMVEALSNDLSNPSCGWLEASKARQCARQFLDAFAPAVPTVVTNHLNGLWWPISGAADEWSFVAIDDDTAALWLMAR